MSRMKSMKRPAAMFDRAAGGNVVSNVKSKDNACKGKCFEEKNRCRVCQETRKVGRQGRSTRHKNEAWNVSTDFDVWLEIRAELEKSIVEQNYRQNIGKTVEIVKVC